MDVLDKSVEYDKALARAKELINEKLSDDTRRKIVEHIFPQLKETVEEKDIRISKSIIECLKGTMPDNEYRREYISWLEKRGSTMTLQEEHKFNIGEWIIYDNLLKVVDIKPNEYVLQFRDGKETTDDISYVDKFYRLWTIEDANAGDVLAIEWEEKKDSSKWQKIVLFKHFDKNRGVHGYGGTFKIKNNELLIDDVFPLFSKSWTKYLHPATKEQQELIFQKLIESGFKWDTMKKELVCDTNSSGM